MQGGKKRVWWKLSLGFGSGKKIGKERGERGGDGKFAHGGVEEGVESQLRRGEEVGREEGRIVLMESWKEGEVRKLMTVARRVAEEEEEEEVSLSII